MSGKCEEWLKQADYDIDTADTMITESKDLLKWIKTQF